MVNTNEVKLNLSENQMQTLAQGHTTGMAVKLRLRRNIVLPNGGMPLILTRKLKSLMTAILMTSQFQLPGLKEGVFLPVLLAAIPTIASVIGGVSGLTGVAANNKKLFMGRGYASIRKERLEIDYFLINK